MEACFEANDFNENHLHENNFHFHLYEQNLYENKNENKKYFLYYGKKIYPFEVIKRNDDNIILIKSEKYEIQLNPKELSLLTNEKFFTLDNAYEFIIKSFKQKRIKICQIIEQNSIELILIKNEKNIKITLIYNKEENDLIIEKLFKYVNILDNNIYQINKSIFDIKNEFILFKDAIINQLQNYFNYFNSFINGSNFNIKKNKISKNKESKENKGNKGNAKIVKNEVTKKETKKGYQLIDNIAKDSYAEDNVNNTFTVFKSINDLSNLILVYSTKQNSITSYNLLENKKIIEIKKAHDDYITNLRHYLDKIYKRDLIISISGHNNNLKLWNYQNWEIVCDIKKINTQGDLDSACILKDNNLNNYFILTSNNNEKFEIYENAESIKVFDFIGTKIKEIKDSAQRTLYIDSFYDNTTQKNYIITGNEGLVKSYDYSDDILYHDYKDNSENDINNCCHNYIIVNCYKDIIKLIESSWDNNVRIWNFHTGQLLKKIYCGENGAQGMCLWDSNNVFIGCGREIQKIDLKNGKIVENIKCECNKKEILTIQKITHPLYGECLLFQGTENNCIKLLIFEK